MSAINIGNAEPLNAGDSAIANLLILPYKERGVPFIGIHVVRTRNQDFNIYQDEYGQFSENIEFKYGANDATNDCADKLMLDEQAYVQAAFDKLIDPDNEERRKNINSNFKSMIEDEGLSKIGVIPERMMLDSKDAIILFKLKFIY